jgi:hypothetical protein
MVDADDQLPEMITVRVWARREVGQSCADIAAWLDRMGYPVSSAEVEQIASRHAQGLEAAWARWGRRQGQAPGSASQP